MTGDADPERDEGGRMVEDRWTRIGSLTPARVALGRTGASLSTRQSLALALAHSQARDAVHRLLDADALVDALGTRFGETRVLRSAAKDRAEYLLDPDLGRRLIFTEADTLERGAYDLVIVLTDGLSPIAVQRHAVPLLEALWPLLHGWSVAPPVIALQGRVAIADEIGERLGARCAVNIIGERPGLSSPDSLGAYITYAPRRGTTDEARNCISNIRPGGLTATQAAAQMVAIVTAALANRCSGIALQGARPALAAETRLDPPS